MRGDAQSRWTLVEDLESRMTPTAVIGTRILVGFDPGESEAAVRAVAPEAATEEKNE